MWLIDYTEAIAEARRRRANEPPAEPLDPEVEAELMARFQQIGDKLQEMVEKNEPDRVMTLADLEALPPSKKRNHLSVVPDPEEAPEDEAPAPTQDGGDQVPPNKNRLRVVPEPDEAPDADDAEAAC